MNSSTPALNLYRHSGNFSMTGMTVATIGGIAVAIGLAWIYELLLYWIPLIYVNVLACAGFGAGVGAATALILRTFKCRNTAINLGLGLLIAAIALVASWEFWIYRLLDNEAPGEVSLLELVSRPDAFWGLILEVNKVGTWGLNRSSGAINGVMLWLVWAAEAAIVLVVAFIAAKFIGQTPFCESCGTWCEKVNVGAGVQLADATTMQLDAQRIAGGEFALITQRGLRADDAAQWIGFEVHACPKCQQTVTLSVTHGQLVEGNGAVSTKEKPLVRYALITPEQYEQFRAAFTPLVEQSATPEVPQTPA